MSDWTDPYSVFSVPHGVGERTHHDNDTYTDRYPDGASETYTEQGELIEECEIVHRPWPWGDRMVTWNEEGEVINEQYLNE